jgi:mannose-6-phosphate isomerase-like protein (cupin superfamily)
MREATVDKFLKIENRHTGEVLRMRRVRDANGQVNLILEGSLPPHCSGPPLHAHFQEHEQGHVAAGTLGAIVGNKKITVQAGEPVDLPAGVPHRWWNAGEDPLEFNGRVVPVVDLDRFLQAIFAVINASNSGRPSLFYVAHVLQRHRHTQELRAVPAVIRKVVFPAVLLIGRILGKYRGDNWPGSPASCPSAPEAAA